MSVNRYNPYFNPTGLASHASAFQGQTPIPTASSSARNIEQAVWQWVPDGPDIQGPYRVLMTGLPTENVQKKDIIELFSSHVTPNVAVEPLFSENGFNGSCIFTINNAEEVLKTYDQFEGKYFDDMSTQIKVEYLIRPGGRIPAKIARQIIHDDQIIAMAPISARSIPVQPSAYTPMAPPTGPANMQQQPPAAPIAAGNVRGVPRGPAHVKANGAPSNAAKHVPSQPRNAQQQQHQNGHLAKAHTNTHSNNSANYHNNANSSTAGKSLLQRMGIGLAERISGAPVSGSASPAGSAGFGKGKKAGGAGPARPVSSISNQSKRNMKPYAPFPPNASTHPKSHHANGAKGKQQQQPKRKDTQQEILDRELENFQKRRGK